MSDSTQTRRSFVGGLVAGGAALGLGGLPRTTQARARARSLKEDPTGQPKAGKIGDFKISLAQWSLHKALFARNAKINNLDFPQIAREQYGIEGVEFVNQFFKDKAHDEGYLKELKKRANDYGVTCVLIMVDLDKEFDMSAEAPETRAKTVEKHKQWVDAAAALGCHAIRINTGEHYSPTNVANVADSCGKLTEYGASHKIEIICENHGGPSSNPDALIALMRAVNKPTFGTLPDFGNFPANRSTGIYSIDIYDAIARMMPYAHGVSAKSYDFAPDGRETRIDYARVLKIVTDAGYNSWVGIEYEGSRLTEPEGIKATKKLLEGLRGSTYTP